MLIISKLYNFLEKINNGKNQESSHFISNYGGYGYNTLFRYTCQPGQNGPPAGLGRHHVLARRHIAELPAAAGGSRPKAAQIPEHPREIGIRHRSGRRLLARIPVQSEGPFNTDKGKQTGTASE